MLKMKFTDNRQEAFWVMEKSYAIGRSRDNHLVIEDDSVAENHARLIREGDNFNLRALAGSSSTFVNGKQISNKQVHCGDILRFGNVSLEIIDPLLDVANAGSDYWSLIADSSWLAGQEFPLILMHNQPVILGRGSQCDIVFPNTHLSRNHAQITLTDDGLMLKDLASANGTFVNDRKISEEEIRPGDRIRLDVYSFRLFGPGIHLPKAATTSFNIAVPEKTFAPPPASPAPTPAPPNPSKAKAWKTRPTSPGNREEPTPSTKGKILGWVAATVIISVFISITLYVLTSS